MKKLIGAAVLVAILITVIVVVKGRQNAIDATRIEASGTIETTEIDVASKTSGRVAVLNITEGDPVKKGDLLLELEHNELDAQHKVAVATIAAAKSRVSQAEVNLANLKDNFARIEALLQSGAATQQVYDDMKAKVTLAEREQEAARASLAQAQAQKELIETQLENSRIISPATGYVLSKNVEPGEVILPGAPVATIGELTSVWLKIYVKETQLGHIKLGQPVKVRIDSFPKRDFEGKITYISNEAEFTPKSIQTKDERVKLVYAVKVTIPNPNLELKPGMPADAVIEVGSSDDK